MAKKAAKKTTKKASDLPKSAPKGENVTLSETKQQEVQPKAEADAAQQAAIDKALAEITREAEAKARAATEAILGGNAAAGLGTSSGDVEKTQDLVQADRIPGTRRKDKTYVPESVYDDRDGSRKKVLDYNRFRYCMIPEEDFHTYTMNLWKFCKYDGGSLSGLLNDGWQGTGDAIFMRDIRGYCRRGDVYLMYIELARYNEILAEDRDNADKATKAPVGHFADVAYDKGIRAMAQIDGKDIL